jgi:hypothetical protein
MASVALSALLVAACAGLAGDGSTPTPAEPSGIRGTVILGPTCPVEGEPGAHEPVPCLTPYMAQLAIVNEQGDVVARVTSAEDGTFQVDLPPGDYVVTPQSGDPFPVAQPVPVSIPVGTYVDIQVNYDTGIR